MCEIDLERNTDIRKDLLRETFNELKRDYHFVYALLMGLPKANCFLWRDYDAANDLESNDDESKGSDVFSLQEFFDRYDSFHTADTFILYLKDDLERIDPSRYEEYSPVIDIESRNQLSIDNLVAWIDEFLESYCEHCYRMNDPLELTPEKIAHFGFTQEDVEELKPILKPHNDAARSIIWAEYEKLSGLDFIRENRR